MCIWKEAAIKSNKNKQKQKLAVQDITAQWSLSCKQSSVRLQWKIQVLSHSFEICYSQTGLWAAGTQWDTSMNKVFCLFHSFVFEKLWSPAGFNSADIYSILPEDI